MQTIYDSSLSGVIPGARIAILQSKWHSDYTDSMVTVCRELLEKAQASEIDHHVVPGCYELPLAATKLARSFRYDAIVVFGAIVKGETDHYTMILDTCIQEFGRLMCEQEIPIVMEIMPVHDIEHLAARSSGPHNKGIEAAKAAVDMLLWLRGIAEAEGKNP